jgi:protocatechuate 3,4-dioxygenase beta subunit
MTISRRRILRLSGAAALLGAAGVRAAGALPRTPSQTSGPFYPADKPLDRDADLTRVRGRGERATGQVVHVMGRVLDVDGRPVKAARIEIWQANTHGRYAHPNDANTAPLDPGFEGYADLLTDEDGRYRFKTIKPGAYPAGRAMRPPHIHFGIAAGNRRLVTQMYFSGDARQVSELADDFVFAAAGANRRLLVADVRPPTPDLEADSLLARWDIVLGS